jgi:nucleotide-binding universal stress UspA family protein
MTHFNLKKILVPVDFSRFSLEALRAAVDIAEIRKAGLTVLHVAEEPPLSGTYGQESVLQANWKAARDEIYKESERELEAMASEANAGPNTERLSIWGDPTNEIIRMAGNGKFDLIVMSTHGRTGLSRLLMGSVAERVIRHAPCPVFVIRGRE